MWRLASYGDINPVEFLIEQFCSAAHEIWLSMFILYCSLKFSQVLQNKCNFSLLSKKKKASVAGRDSKQNEEGGKVEIWKETYFIYS